MATIKSHSDLKQSKKLAEFLPMESADMYYRDWKRATKDIRIAHVGTAHKKDLPCWSLTALLRVIPKRIKDYNVLRIDIGEKDFSIWYDEVGYGVNTELPDITMECPVDACCEMIFKLKERKLL